MKKPNYDAEIATLDAMTQIEDETLTEAVATKTVTFDPTGYECVDAVTATEKVLETVKG